MPLSPRSEEVNEMYTMERVDLERRIRVKHNALAIMQGQRPEAVTSIELITGQIGELVQQLAATEAILATVRQPLEVAAQAQALAQPSDMARAAAPPPASPTLPIQQGRGRSTAATVPVPESPSTSGGQRQQAANVRRPMMTTRSQLRRQAVRDEDVQVPRQLPTSPLRLSNFVDEEPIDDEPLEERWILGDGEDDEGAQDDRRNIEHFFQINETETSASRSRNTRQELSAVLLRNFEDAHRPDLIIERVIEELFRRVIGERRPPKYISIQLLFPGADRPFTVPLRPPEQNTPSVVAAALEQLQKQSGDIFDLFSGPIESKVIAVWPLPNRRGHGACNNEEHRVTTRVRSMVTVENPGDRFCLAKSIILGLGARKHLPRNMAAFRWLCADEETQTRRAIRLMELARVPITLRYYTVQHAKRIQRAINEVYGRDEVRLVIFAKENLDRIIYKGFNRRARFNLCLYLEKRHYSYIHEPRQLFKTRAFCIDCERSIQRRTFHPNDCVAVCRLCYRFGPGHPCVPDGEGHHFCADCGFTFASRNCYQFHKARGVRNGRPICAIRYMCRQCGAIIFSDQRTHKCYDEVLRVPCKHCDAVHTLEFPYCYIQPLDFRPLGPPPPPPPAQVPAVPQQEVEEDEEEMEMVEEDESGNEDDDEVMTVRDPELEALFARVDEVIEELHAADEEEENRAGVHTPDPMAEIEEAERERRAREPLRFVWFDIESTQTTRITVAQKRVNRHVPNLLIADVLCERCLVVGIGVGDNRMAVDCLCGINQRNRALYENYAHCARRLVFKAFREEDRNPVDAFLDFLLNTGPFGTKTIVLSHNGGKYDMHLCLDRLYQRNVKNMNLTTNGLKIYSIHIRGRNVRETIFRDSINFFLCALKSLPKTFGLGELVADKPFFPHLYNRLDRMQKVRTNLPKAKYYDPDRMVPAERQRFFDWYNANRDTTPFHLAHDLVEYCANDVAILRESCLRFRRLFLEVAELDPFVKAMTIAGLAMTTFRKNHLPYNTLINLPEGGFNLAEKQSVMALKYMRLYEMAHNCQVQTMEWSMGEARVQDSGYRLDGLVVRREDGLRPLAIEFMGCYYHGCTTCYKDRSLVLAGGRTAEELWQRTQRRLNELRYIHGYDMEVVWACEFKAQLRQNPDYRRMYDQIFIASPMDPRKDAYRGGRTEPFAFHHRCKENEEIVCIDINSLYPNEMKKCAFPTGMPTVLKRDRLPLNSLPWTSSEQNPYKGLLKCRILAPSDLRFPLLAYRTRTGVLTFPLCGSCAEERNQGDCNHVNAKRSWVTGYTHAELNKALALGYTVTDLFEVWNWNEWAEKEKKTGLFTRYVDQFLKIKAEASGLPANHPDKNAYIEQYLQDEGVRLDPERIEKNEGLRFISKIMMNSLYGKFGQRPYQTTVQTTTTARALHNLLDDDTLVTVSVEHVSRWMDRVVTRRKNDFVKAPRTNCLPIAIYVTSYSRLRLYSFMEEVMQCGGKMLYVDTDSIFYVKRIGEQGVKEGDCLGQMKREYADRKIVEMIMAGPKNYGFLHVDPNNAEDIKAVSKIRGFSLNYSAAQIINFLRMKALIFATFSLEDDETLDDIIPPSALNIEADQILRTKRSVVYSRRSLKQWRPVYNKGRVMRGMQAVPFGYRPNECPLVADVPERWPDDVDDGLPPVQCNVQ